jgi:hypothetical protein
MRKYSQERSKGNKAGLLDIGTVVRVNVEWIKGNWTTSLSLE